MRLSERMTSETLSQRDRKTGRTPGGMARTNMITDATRLNPGIRIQAVPVGGTINLKNSYLYFLTAGFGAQLLKHDILKRRALHLAPKTLLDRD